jgi:hypothetical protein
MLATRHRWRFMSDKTDRHLIGNGGPLHSFDSHFKLQKHLANEFPLPLSVSDASPKRLNPE